MMSDADPAFRLSYVSEAPYARGAPPLRPSAGAGATPSSDRLSARYNLPPLPSDLNPRNVGTVGITARATTPQANSYGGFGFLNYVQEPVPHKTWGAVAAGPEWDNDLVLSETHYHHGDHHHNHHQRHIHHFHDLHLIGSAEEVLDLRGSPAVRTKIIPGDNAAPQMTLRPDVLGRQAFEAGADQYFGSLSARFESLMRGGSTPASVVGVGVTPSSAAGPSGVGGGSGSVTGGAGGAGTATYPSVAFTSGTTTTTVNIQRSTPNTGN